MSLRQLAETLRHGRKITFHVAGSEPITGYLAGMDASYFLVLVPTGDSFTTEMVYRPNNHSLTLHPESTYQNEPSKQAMEKILHRFRTFMHHRVSRGESDSRKAG
jgi:hypothetical protein